MQHSESGLVNSLIVNWDVALDPVNRKDNFFASLLTLYNVNDPVIISEYSII